MSKRGYACVGLDNPKFKTNVGSVLRAGSCYGAKMIAASGERYYGSATDTPKTWRHTPFLQVNDLRDIIPFNCVPIAVDIVDRATPLPEYNHPDRAFYIFGAEDATLGEEVLSWCENVIYIPTNSCMNLAATVNVVLYDRAVKRGEF